LGQPRSSLPPSVEQPRVVVLISRSWSMTFSENRYPLFGIML